MSKKKQNKPITTPATEFSKKCKGVVIDGANILSAEPASATRLVNTIEFARDRGWKVLVGLKTGTYYWNLKNEKSPLDDENKKLLKSLKKSNTISLINDAEDDLHLIRVALNGPYYLLSRDFYKDWREQNPSLKDEIEQCHMFVECMGDEVSIDLPPSPQTTMIVPSDAIEENEGKNIRVEIGETGTRLELPFNTIIGKNWLAEQGVDNPYISRSHFRIITTPDGPHLEDLKSKNGTFIDDFRLSAHHPHSLDDVKSFNLAGEVDLFFC